MNDSFNLVHEPWIEVIDNEGNEREVSISELFENADMYTDFASAIGTVNFAILRVLLAILYRSWDGVDWHNRDEALDHWEEKWNSPSLLDEAVQGYLNKWQHRFDLRDEKVPFFQVADLYTSKNEWKSLDLLVPDMGDEGDLFSMRTGSTSLTPAEAARMVIHAMAYDFNGIKSGAVGDPRVKGGRGYPIGIGWAGWLGGTILKGENLRETILLNYAPNPSNDADTYDVPQWELSLLGAAPREDVIYNLSKPEQNGTTGLVELLTWPQRRIRLGWVGNRVDRVLITNGDRVGYVSKFGIETMTPWRFSDPQTKKAKQITYMPRTLDSGRAIWHSVAGLLPGSPPDMTKTKYGDAATARPAETVNWVATLVDERVLPKDKSIRLHMVTMEYGAKSSSFKGVVQDALVIKTPLLETVGEQGEQLRDAARVAVSRTDETAKLVGSFYRNLIFATSGEAQADTTEIRRQFFSAVDHEFRSWLRDLPDATDPHSAVQEWSTVLKTTALSLAHNSLGQQGPNVWTGRWSDDRNVRVTGANAELWLRRGLKRLLDPVSTETESEGE